MQGVIRFNYKNHHVSSKKSNIVMAKWVVYYTIQQYNVQKCIYLETIYIDNFKPVVINNKDLRNDFEKRYINLLQREHEVLTFKCLF